MEAEAGIGVSNTSMPRRLVFGSRLGKILATHGVCVLGPPNRPAAGLDQGPNPQETPMQAGEQQRRSVCGRSRCDIITGLVLIPVCTRDDERGTQ